MRAHRLRVTRHWIGLLLTASVVVASTGHSSPARLAADSGEIAFVRGARSEVHCAIVLMNADGSEQRQLTGWTASCYAPPVWSPDGRRLAIYARGALWTMNPDGTGRTRLSPADYVEEFTRPSFSPDGTRIAFQRNPSSTSHASAIYVVRAGRRPTRLTSERFAYDPLWSPRGDLIAFRSDRDDDEGDIYVMRPDGSGQRRLTREREDIESFAWSPDGRFLAFGFYDGPVYRIAASGGSRRLLARVTSSEPGLVWSPDGTHIAYQREANLDSVRDDIWLMTAVGYGERRLTRTYYNAHPSWSPNSQRIAFDFLTRLKGPLRSGIAVIGVDGRNRRVLTNAPWVDSYPAWQPVP
jgi:Tol biopolymer transport system component